MQEDKDITPITEMLETRAESSEQLGDLEESSVSDLPPIDSNWLLKDKLFLVPLFFFPLLSTFIEFSIVGSLQFLVESDFAGYPSALTSWVFTSLQISSCVSTPIAGRLGDILGKKRIFSIILVAYILAILFCGFATTLPIMILCRTIQGAGSGAWPLLLGILRDTFPPSKVSPLLATASGFFPAGITLGLLLGGWLTEKFGWRSCFYLGAGSALFILIFFYFFVNDYRMKPPVKALKAVFGPIPGRERLEHKARDMVKVTSVDWVGALMFGLAITLICLSVSLVETKGVGFGSDQWPTLSCLFCGVALVVFWWAISLVREHPFIPPALLKQGSLRSVYISSLMVSCIMMTLHYILPSYLKGVVEPPVYGHGIDSAFQVGLRMAPLGPSEIVGTLTLAHLANKLPGEKIFIRTSAILSVSIGVLSIWHRTTLSVVIMQICIGMPLAMSLSSVALAAAQMAPQEHFATAVSLCSLGGAIGKSIGPVIASAIMQANRYDDYNIKESGFVIVWRMLASVALFNSLLLLFNTWRFKNDRTHHLKTE
eukprot:gnl/Dysnectes_brevis/1302_a1458_2827.p1 GENE.gnl/Dysnectes_brevis/1302_a1458_2827~~gnl/Dysnectes_brevis/1302_a1458_2827.p1  ORF type:complete len:542 (-),score=84.03 gnl/Dysnectes_brevis/1302_a1458_2827:78-1703(-)